MQLAGKLNLRTGDLQDLVIHISLNLESNLKLTTD